MTDSLARPANTRSAAHPETKRPARRAQSERREEATNTILDAAEKLFALHGRDGVTLKAIATGANVDTALIHYYFGDKDRVFRAVFARRSGEVNAARIAAMDAYEAQVGTDMTIEGVLDIFLRPIYEMVIDKGEGWVYFAAIVGHANASHFGGKIDPALPLIDDHLIDGPQKDIEDALDGHVCANLGLIGVHGRNPGRVHLA